MQHKITTLKLLSTISIFLVGLLIYSGMNAYDTITWAMEILPVFIAIVLMWGSYRNFPLTPLLYAIIVLHSVVLIWGGMYTYARVPLGFEMAEWFGIERNPYDKLGHFMQGFAPALIAREILVRGHYVRGAKMLNFIIVSIVLAISAFYELIEWWSALILGDGAEEFLGTQGYTWDTQSDMFFALIGAVMAMATLSKWHQKMIERLEAYENSR